MSERHEIKPLAGRTVVVTRAPEQAGELVARLEELGAEVLLLPAVAFAAADETLDLDCAMGQLESFDWVILSSQNAARFFAQRLRAAGIRRRAGGEPKYAAVGPATARAAREEGLEVSFVASRALGEVLAGELGRQVSGKRVLLPRSDRARPGLAAALRAAGAEVVEVVAYRTLAPQPTEAAALERVKQGKVSALTFASPSAFHHLRDELGAQVLQRIAESVAIAAIGPVTADAIREAGVRVAIEASESTGAGLVTAVVDYFARKSPTGVRT